jgi:hypothetical protein
MEVFAGVVVNSGLGAEIVTVAPVTVNVTALLVPPNVVTVTFLAPSAAPREIVNVAVICVPPAFTVVPLIVMPAIAFIVAPDRFVPVIVTGTAEPSTPEVGLMEVSVGAGGGAL